MNIKLRNLVTLALAGTFVLGYSTAHADSTVDIVNALISKGVLTEEEGALLIKGHDGEIEGQKKKEKNHGQIVSSLTVMFKIV